MHDLIASYLFQNKSCPLPGLGNLSLRTTGARADFSNNIINAPLPSIHFEPVEADVAPLLTWLSKKTNAEMHDATSTLNGFCGQLKTNAAVGSGAKLEGVGNFVVDNNGKISFVPVELPNAFTQPVTAERVIRQDTEHNILVGDKETTNIAMTEYLSEEAPKKDRWWIWALVLGVIGLSLILLYSADKNGSTEFGNAIKILSLP